MRRYAAVDIGSNSIRMLAAETTPQGATRFLAAERQVVRLGESVFRAGRIGREAMEFAAATLERMAEIYNRHGVIAVRAVATSAVRDGEVAVRAKRRLCTVRGARPIEAKKPTFE